MEKIYEFKKGEKYKLNEYGTGLLVYLATAIAIRDIDYSVGPVYSWWQSCKLNILRDFTITISLQYKPELT